MPTNGNLTIGAARTTAGFMNNPAFTRAREKQARQRSGFFGNMGKRIKETFGSSSTDREMKLATSAAMVRIEKTQGDTHNWTMQKALKGRPTFGDQRPETGPTLGFLHAETVLHKTRSMAVPLPADMDQIRAASTIDINWDASVRDELMQWNGDYLAHEIITTTLMGASPNLLRPTTEGARAIDLGRGAGVQVSPKNIIVRGLGKVSGATLAAREADAISKIGSLSTATAAHLLTPKSLMELSEELSSAQTEMVGLDIGGEEKFLLCLPSISRNALQGHDSALVDYAKYTAAWGKDSPLLRMAKFEIGKFVVFYDDILNKYMPDVTGSNIIWGKNTTEFQSWKREDLTTAQKGRGVGIIYGQKAILQAYKAGIEYTVAEGDHETSKEIATMVRRSSVRAMWKDKQDIAALPEEYGTMLFVYAEKGITHGV